VSYFTLRIIIILMETTKVIYSDAANSSTKRSLASIGRALIMGRSQLFMGHSHRLSKKLHSLPSSIRQIIQPRGHPRRGPTAKPPFGSRLTLSAPLLHADAHPPG
jgi:hypothetical protein